MSSGALAGYRLASTLARRIPEGAGRPLARAVGRLVGRLDNSRRRQVGRHVRRVQGADLPATALRRATGRVFASYADYWYRSLRLPAMDTAELGRRFSIDGYRHLEEARTVGPGPILALPHLGTWEWAGLWLARVKRVPVSAVVERLKPPELFEWFRELRAALGIEVIPLGEGAGTQVLRSVADGRVVCLLSDRLVGGSGVDVEFFGETTRLPAGPATLALRSGAPLLPVGVYDTPDGCHAIVRPAVPAERTGRLRDDVTRMTTALAIELEWLISRAPDQWHLVQPNWPTDRVAIERAAADR